MGVVVGGSVTTPPESANLQETAVATTKMINKQIIPNFFNCSS
jgi:hypothetical protein